MYDYPENDDAHEWDQAEEMASEAFDLYEKGKMRQALEKLSSAIELAPATVSGISMRPWHWTGWRTMNRRLSTMSWH